MTVTETATLIENGENGEKMENPCKAYQETLREVFVHILSRRGYPLTARLFSMAAFAFEVDGLVCGTDPEFSEDRLAVEVDKVADEVYERLWLSEVAKSNVDLELPMSMLQSLLLGRVEHCRPGFKEMIESAWSRYAPESAGENPEAYLRLEYNEGRTHVRCKAMAVRYKEERDRLYAALGSEIEEHLSDFCLRFVANSAPADAPTLLSWVQELILHVMLQKFFLAADPDLSALSAPQSAGDVPAGQGQALVGRVERHLDRETVSMTTLRDMLADQGMQDLSHTSLLILF